MGSRTTKIIIVLYVIDFILFLISSSSYTNIKNKCDNTLCLYERNICSHVEVCHISGVNIFFNCTIPRPCDKVGLYECEIPKNTFTYGVCDNYLITCENNTFKMIFIFSIICTFILFVTATVYVFVKIYKKKCSPLGIISSKK